MKSILGSRMNKLTPEQEEFKDKLFKKCLSRKNRNMHNLPVVEVLPPGIAIGAVSTVIERQIVGWRGCGGMGNLSKHPPTGRKK